jgi:hypothetical protein
MTKTHSRSTSFLKSNDNTRSTLPARRVEPTSQTSPQQDELGRIVPDRRQPSLPPPSNGTLNRNISLQTSVPPQPLHPEIRSVVNLTHVHAHKIYMSGPLILRIERLPDGYQPIKDKAWRDVWAQLGGTTLSIWDMKEIEEASKQGKEVPPTYTNVTDAVSLFSNTRLCYLIHSISSCKFSVSSRYLHRGESLRKHITMSCLSTQLGRTSSSSRVKMPPLSFPGRRRSGYQAGRNHTSKKYIPLTSSGSL